MRNNFLYILIICAFTEILTQNEENKPAGNKAIKHSREYYEEEANKDTENLLLGVTNRNFSEENEDNTELLNAPKSTKIMARIDRVLEKPKPKKAKRKQTILRYNDQNYADNFNRGNMQNFPSSDNNALAQSNTNSVKSRISGGRDAQLRSQVNHVDVQPEVFPIVTDGNGNDENREMASKEVTLPFNGQYNEDDEDKSIRLINQEDINQKDSTVISIPMKQNFDINELFNQLHVQHDRNIITQKPPENNVRMQDYLNTIYKQSGNHLRPGNRFNIVRNRFNYFNDKLEPEHRDHLNTFVLRDNVVKVNSASNDQLNEYMNYFGFGNDLRASHTTLSYQINGPNKQGDKKKRRKRSTNTQAGYTQDPDTCKTYNENLVKLWSNLSKLLNVTEQPNDRALHNIAVMIQAYLEHQNAKKSPEIIKERREGPRDKISEIINKIRKLLAGDDTSAEKITKTIKKYLKPDYTDAESEDCKEVNQEYLDISVDVLYKTYLENIQCQSEEDDTARHEKPTLREKNGRTGKFNGKTVVTLSANHFKSEHPSIYYGDEMYNDYQKGKMPRRRPINKNRRVFKASKNQKSRSAYRAGNENEIEKLQTRSRSAKKKQKKSSLKRSVKSQCESYATRQLIVSLRSVMERFMGLLECQIDNTLRSLDRNSKNPYYSYDYRSYSEADNVRHKKMKSKPLAKDSERIRHNPYKKIHIKRRDTSIESDEDVHMIDDDEDSESTKEFSFSQVKSMNSEMPSVSRDTNDREPATYKNKQHGDSDLANYNDYFQAPPLYDDYDGTYKRHKASHSNGFSSVNKISKDSLKNKKLTRDKQANKEKASSNKEPETDNSDEYDEYYEEMFTQEPNNNQYIADQQSAHYIETPFTDLTKLRSDDQIIAEKSKIHAKSFESIAEFLKKARDSSLQTPEFAVPFALDTNKGYVELTHLIKYPKIIVYRPQFLVKNTMPYDDFLKTINNINMTNDDVRLMKIVRHLPDSSVKVLFETEDFEAPLEVRNLDGNRRSGWLDPESYQLESDTTNESTNTDITDEDSGGFLRFDFNETRRIDLGPLVKSDVSTRDHLPPDFNPESDSLRAKEETFPTIHSENKSNLNSTLNSKTRSSELSTGFSSKPSDVDSAVGSDSQLGLGRLQEFELNTDLNLGNKSNSEHTFFGKLFFYHPKTLTRSDLDSNFSSASTSIPDSQTPSLPSESDSDANSRNQEVEKEIYSEPQSFILQWWSTWKNMVKDKIKDIVGKMATLADKLDLIVKI